MPHCTRVHLIKFLIVLLFALPFNGKAQLRQPYSGPLQVGNLNGNANYTYKVVEGDTLLDGIFQIKRSSLEALLQKSDSSFSIIGNFTNNYPSGDWRFQFGEFKSDSTAQVVDFQYKLNVDGVQNEAFGKINMGKPDGIWRFNTNQIKNSEIAQVLFKSTIEFDKGIPQKNFQIQNTTSTLVGRFLRNGLAHDEWTLYTEDDLDAVETWQFSDGWLREIKVNDNTKITFFSQVPQKSKTIAMDSRYFEVLKLRTSQNENYQVLKQNMSALLEENAAQYEKINALLADLSESSSFYPEFKVRVGHYPLDSIETGQLASIKDLHGRSKPIVKDFLDNTQLNILRLSDERANYLYKAIQAISNQFIIPFDKFNSYDKKEIIELLSRPELISSLWPDGIPNKQLVLDNSSESTYTGPNADQFEFGEASMAGLEQMAAYIASTTGAIAAELNVKLAKDKRQQEYVTIEEQLIQKRNKLNEHVNAIYDSIPKTYGDALKNVQRFADERLATYSTMQESDGKLTLGRKLVNCFDKLYDLSKAVSIQPKRDMEVEEKYLDAIWNPFMATIMNEEVKKHITTSYRRVLIPYLVNQTTTALNCENAASLVRAFDETHERLLQLRDEDTQKLERKLKREQDPNVVMQLFNLQSLGEN